MPTPNRQKPTSVYQLVRQRSAEEAVAFKSVLRVRAAAKRSYVLIVEPWAEEFTVGTDEECQVVALNPKVPPTFEVEPCRIGDLIVYVNESGSTYEFWRGAVREFSTPVPIPG